MSVGGWLWAYGAVLIEFFPGFSVASGGVLKAIYRAAGVGSRGLARHS